MENKITEQCPHCGNDKDNYFMAFGENYTGYFHCDACGHDFIIDMSKYIHEQEKEIADEHAAQG